MQESGNNFRVQAVSDRSQLTKFISQPWSIYKDDPNWVPPLLFEQRQRLSPKNPFFEHARWQAWLAYRGSRIVGRISAQIDDLYKKSHEESVGYFGMLEAENNAETFAKLLATSENWLREQDIGKIRGPFNLSINEECGLLVDGFDTPPFVMMGHAREYYSQNITAAGYGKAKDLLAYSIRPDFEVPRAMSKLVEHASKKVQVRCMRRKELPQELEILRDIFNDAWANNWGFVPFTKAEFEDIGQMLSLLVYDDFIQIAEIDSQPVAMIVGIPNINEVISDLNGRLLPLGWAKLLWRLKVGNPNSARVSLMGVRRIYQNTRLGLALAHMVIDAFCQSMIRRGMWSIETSWILEDNAGMRSIMDAIGGVLYKRYRIYEKDL